MIRDSQEKVIGFVSIYRDISQRKRLEKEKEQYARKLEAKIEEVERTKSELQEAQEKLVRTEKLAAIGELAGGVGHELRNPLGAIKNTAYLLNMILTEPDPQVKEALAILDKEVTKSDRIIADLLDFSRPGKTSILTVDINRIIQEVVRDTTLPQNVEMSTTLQRNLPPALADADQLQRVLSNLVTNALQAMPDGGKLTLTTRGKDSLVEMAVTDTGVGIPEENLGKVFEPLFTTKARGVGLGLALSRALVDRQRGTLEVESELRKGSTFTLTLPAGGKEERQDAGESLHPDCG
jgi:signal transduction histidine kinase